MGGTLELSVKGIVECYAGSEEMLFFFTKEISPVND
jgi:hypothetical protein